MIVIPGLMGSRLVATQSGEQLWPPGLWAVLTGGNPNALALSIGSADPHAYIGGPIPRGLLVRTIGADFYGDLLETLSALGYKCVVGAEITADTDCVLMAWDWRRDLVEAAAKLDGLIERLREVRLEPALMVDLVAHSAGGLVARYFVRFGSRDVLDLSAEAVRMDETATSKVRKLALIGVPNYGSIFGLQRLMRGYRVGLVGIPPEIMATMPSIYQLLPHPERDWIVDSQGNRLRRDLYDVEVWREARESIFDPQVRERIRRRFPSTEEAESYLAALERYFARALRRGRRLHEVLSMPAPDLSSYYIVLGSDCRRTPAICLLEEVDGQREIRLHPQDVVNRVPGVDYEQLMLEPGDGRVTRASLLARDTLDPAARLGGFFPIHYVAFGCQDHSALPNDFGIRHNLLNFLLY
ncbi:MAG: hypothetical protein GWN84_23230 [Gammaproteobacteria bacterium]|nr:hypothetical protein [Gammaproteobacteria bacterium]NIR85516.1 hypothetical protein [Gammaproteobacteria bacterium]NIR89775.1 hypothetical protein [Gammaproteobacteria bacterium]NIU06651.1 hypothetical protein [Gammaproteobacteria bacterium]NIV75042.1 hypothetical protein [Gammaproteobacteria bacterium]